MMLTKQVKFNHPVFLSIKKNEIKSNKLKAEDFTYTPSDLGIIATPKKLNKFLILGPMDIRFPKSIFICGTTTKSKGRRKSEVRVERFKVI